MHRPMNVKFIVYVLGITVSISSFLDAWDYKNVHIRSAYNCPYSICSRNGVTNSR